MYIPAVLTEDPEDVYFDILAPCSHHAHSHSHSLLRGSSATERLKTRLLFLAKKVVPESGLYSLYGLSYRSKAICLLMRSISICLCVRDCCWCVLLCVLCEGEVTVTLTTG